MPIKLIIKRRYLGRKSFLCSCKACALRMVNESLHGKDHGRSREIVLWETL
jgi:hypothetical protein